MSVIINPGSGPVSGATSVQALANAQVFANEIHARLEGPLGTEGDGRWLFRMTRDDRTVEVEMPGLPLDRVRWVDDDDQDIWQFPRLYVDGSSWVWKYAVGMANHMLDGRPGDDD